MNSRDKGKRGERMLAEELRNAGYEAHRGVQYQGGRDSPDVETNIPNVHIECKFCSFISFLNCSVPRPWM